MSAFDLKAEPQPFFFFFFNMSINFRLVLGFIGWRETN